jgi:serine/threonine protein kinase
LSAGMRRPSKARKALSSVTLGGVDFVGTVLGGKYRVVTPLGSGGMGAVYEAVTDDGARVAVKILHQNASNVVLSRFKREAQSASALQHPNIVRILDFRADPEEPPFLVMELLVGSALSQIINTEHTISASRAAHIAVQLLDALAAAHHAGIVHRDIKPANVMLCDSPSPDFVKLVDFGIAKIPAFATKLTETGTPVGTLAYMAPEQLLDLEVDGRADVYAAGTMMYHAVAGHHPFDEASVSHLMNAICSKRPPPLVEVSDAVDAAFSALIDRAMEKDPSKRFSSAAEMAHEIRRWMQDSGASTVVGAPPRSMRLQTMPMAPRQAANLPKIGDLLLEKYRIDRVVGQGGMGIVYEAHHALLEQSVALKLLLTSANPDATTRFVNEAKLAARIKSDHVPRVLDVGVLPGGLPYIAMDLLRGHDLSALLRERGSLGVGEATRYALQALEPLAQAHALKVVHRDLKPSNLFLETTDEGARLVKVLDFGISKAEGDRASAAPSGAVVGSPSYMAPEQIRDANDVDARTDIWAMGVVLYEMLAGKNPFESAHPGEVFRNVLKRDPERLTTLRPHVPAELEAIVVRCLRRSREERFSNVLELARALVPFAEGRHDERLARMHAALERNVFARSELTSFDARSAPPATVGTWTGPSGLGKSASARWMGVGGLLVGAGVAALVLGLRTPRPATPDPKPITAATVPPPPVAEAVTPELDTAVIVPATATATPITAGADAAPPPLAGAKPKDHRPRAKPEPTPLDRKKILGDRGD